MTHGVVLLDVLLDGLLDNGDGLLRGGQLCSGQCRLGQLTSKKLELLMVCLEARSGAKRWAEEMQDVGGWCVDVLGWAGLGWVQQGLAGPGLVR